MTDLDNLVYTELCRQPYGDCAISAGSVEGNNIEGHEVDDCYLEFRRAGHEPTTVLMTLDEMIAVAWVATGAAWEVVMARKTGTVTQPHVVVNASPDVEADAGEMP